VGVGSEALRKAAEVIEERGAEYGDASTNTQRIADMWSVILKTEVAAENVVLCMIAVKISRLIESPKHEDSAVDIAGYAAVLRECQEK
jgi:hypothetical protein|tara:strand:- start:4108 stop:4371 length:264 start_codon:yes stop_codon:yes gene_type:complete